MKIFAYLSKNIKKIICIYIFKFLFLSLILLFLFDEILYADTTDISKSEIISIMQHLNMTDHNKITTKIKIGIL